MQSIKLTIISRLPHTSQILTGFHLLKEKGYDIQIYQPSNDVIKSLYPKITAIKAEYRKKTIIYDVMDGYQNISEIRRWLENCDYYFKRSYSEDMNEKLFPEFKHKLYPLGLNYHVTYKGNPLNEPIWKAVLKRLLGKTLNSYYTPTVFESEPKLPINKPKIIFVTRLWNCDKLLDYEKKGNVNEIRIKAIRELKKSFGDMFFGGLCDSPLSRKLAPELIVPKKYTKRKAYLEIMHSSDICIATTGLHGSIGWKLGEYVAASKTIISEPFNYSFPGDFRIGENYFVFNNVEECVSIVHKLISSPELLQKIKINNYNYYNNYLRPDMMILNTLKTVDREIGTE